MAAIRGDDPATAVAAVQAGVDLLLMPPDPIATRDAIVAAMADGTLDRDRVVRSVERVLDAKGRRGLLDPAGERPALPGPALLADHEALATEVAARAVTVAGGACPDALAGTTVTVDGPGRALLVAALQAEGVTVAPGSGQQVTLWDGRGPSPAADGAILVVTGSPYAVGRAGPAGTVLATFDDTAAAFRGVARALASGTMTGRSPVSIPRSEGPPLPVGHGLRCTAGG
jgi:beta-N-acetylhexosaminidase